MRPAGLSSMIDAVEPELVAQRAQPRRSPAPACRRRPSAPGCRRSVSDAMRSAWARRWSLAPVPARPTAERTSAVWRPKNASEALARLLPRARLGGRRRRPGCGGRRSAGPHARPRATRRDTGASWVCRSEISVARSPTKIGRPSRPPAGNVSSLVAAMRIGDAAAGRVGARRWRSDAIELALVAERLARPRLPEDVERLAEARLALAVLDAVDVVGAHDAAAADPELEAALADVIERGDLLGDAQRMVQRQHLHGRARPGAGGCAWRWRSPPGARPRSPSGSA